MQISSTKATLLFLLAGVTAATADPQLAMSTISPEEISARISQLNTLRQSETLSDHEKEQLDQLWENAAAIEEMNDRCGSISLTEEMDEDCGRFYQYELPEFETEFFKVTGEIRLSPTRLSNAIEQRRNAINQCFEALQIEAFHPSRYLSLEGRYSPEPLTQGIEVSYNFTLEQNRETLNQLKQQLRQWNSVCGSIVLHSDNSGNLAPVFKDLIQNSRNGAKNTNGTLYFDISRSGYSRSTILVKTAEGIDGNYYLNGKLLFQHKIEPNETIFEINIDENHSNISLRQGNRWKDKAIYDDKDVSRGLVGRFVWEGRKRKHFPGKPLREKPSSASYAPSSTDYRAALRDENDDDEINPVREPDSKGGVDWAFQLVGGINLSMNKASESTERNFGYMAGDNDSLTMVTGMIGGLFTLEFRQDLALAFGGGIAWNNLTLSQCDSYEGCDDVNLFNHSVVPMAQVEFSYGYEILGGPRFTYIFGKNAPTFYLGGFIELANLFGIEMGWVHADNVWNNFYLGIYFKLLPRHFSERMNSLKSNK